MAINLVSMVQFSALFAICSVSYLSCFVSFLSLSPDRVSWKYRQKFAFYIHFFFSREPQLNKRVCLSVSWSVGWSVGRLVRRSVGTAFVGGQR